MGRSNVFCGKPLFCLALYLFMLLHAQCPGLPQTVKMRSFHPCSIQLTILKDNLTNSIVECIGNKLENEFYRVFVILGYSK